MDAKHAGTAGCPSGAFYCQNIGSEPRVLNASFVDDGVCDCCDGSDEPFGRCSNSCLRQAEAAISQLRTELKEVETGLHSRSQYIKYVDSAHDHVLHNDVEYAGDFHHGTRMYGSIAAIFTTMTALICVFAGRRRRRVFSGNQRLRKLNHLYLKLKLQRHR